MKRRILWGLILIASLIHSQWARPGWPDLTWVFLVPVVLLSESRWDYGLALLAGVLKDATQPGFPWLSPMLFVIAVGLGQFAQSALNMRWIVAKLLFAGFLILLDFLRLLFLYGLAPWSLLLETAGWTLLLSVLAVLLLT